MALIGLRVGDEFNQQIPLHQTKKSQHGNKLQLFFPG